MSGRIPFVAAMLCVLALRPHAYQQPVFRADTRAVYVGVSVTRGNTPVPGLDVRDFVLSDNGVRQQIDAVAIEGIPIDVSLFMDTSGSTSLAFEAMQESVTEIAAMLRGGDRFRLLTIGHEVYQTVPWTETSQQVITPDVWVVSGVSLVYDAVYAATAHVAPPGRRHLVVALTDGDDCGSIVQPAQLRGLVGRTDAIVHWVPMNDRGGFPAGLGGNLGRVPGTKAVCDGGPPLDRGALSDLVRGTGGDIHAGVFGNDPVKAFRRVFDDYRQSYVLRYTPEGVARPGWHRLEVQVVSGDYDVRARLGYFGT